MTYALRSLAIAAVAVLASALAVPAQQTATATVGPIQLAPFAFDVPIRIESLHRDVRQIAVECQLWTDDPVSTQLMTEGHVAFQADSVVDASGAVSKDVVVSVYMGDKGFDPADAHSYVCELWLNQNATRRWRWDGGRGWQRALESGPLWYRAVGSSQLRVSGLIR